MNQKMTDFTPVRGHNWLEQETLTVWQIHWPQQPNLAKLERDRGMARRQFSSTDAPLAAAASTRLSTPWIITLALQLLQAKQYSWTPASRGGWMWQRAGAGYQWVGAEARSSRVHAAAAAAVIFPLSSLSCSNIRKHEESDDCPSVLKVNN